MVSSTFYHDFVQNVKNVSSLLLFTTKNPVVSLIPTESQTFCNYYQTIREKIAAKDHPYRIELVKALLLSMFYDMSGVIYRVEQQGQRLQSRADLFFSRFIQLLEQNFRKERRVSWYADQLHITPKYLSEIVRQVSQRTPTDWIDDYVVLEIRVMLKNSTMNIREITEALNFPNQSFLGKYFKDRVGMSPSEFRKSL
jgi:AraC-like DNA-binding protein